MWPWLRGKIASALNRVFESVKFSPAELFQGLNVWSRGSNRAGWLRLPGCFLAVFTFGAMLASFASAQTADEIAKTLTPTANANEYKYNDVLVQIVFDGDGQICRAVWPSNGANASGPVLGVSKATKRDTIAIFNLLAPTAVRGPVLRNGRTVTSIMGQGGGSVLSFQNVLFRLEFGRGTNYVGLTASDLMSTPPVGDLSETNERVGNGYVGDVALLEWTSRACDK
jgi:hypothetical protein